jgi:class 3 adenylate cyclase/DNA-binding SARP family transcriptional activator
VATARTVSVLFSDVVGSTELFTGMGDDAADVVRRDHLDGLGAVVADHGGGVVKGLGDGVMAVFDSAASAVEAGVAIQRCSDDLASRRSIELAVRVGITAGDASQDGDDWFGTPIVEASRLCATAAPGQVLASDLVRNLAGTRTKLAFHSLGTRALKGLPNVVHVHEVRGPDSDDASRPTSRVKASATRPSRFRVMGRFAVEADGVAVAEGQLGSRKARLLVKLLVARREQHVSMDTIIDALWVQGAPDKAVENVASLVARLRGALGSDTIQGGRSGYRLVVPPGCTIDIDDVERLVEEAERRLDAGQPALAATASSHALELLGSGRPFEEEAGEAEWLDDLRREVERLVRRARVVSWRASAGIGEHRRALAVAEEAVGADPLDEEARRAVMLAYHRLGEPGEALAVFEAAREVLVEELGTEPGPETQALYLAVLRGEPVGEEGKRDQGGRSGRDLVGRDAELAALTRCWDDATRAGPSCVVVVGEPGIGATRLVEELAGEVRATGGIVAGARCYEGEESLFLQPIVEVVRDIVASVPSELVARAADGHAGQLVALVPELSRITGAYDYERTSPEIERRRTFEAVAAFITDLSRQRPVLMVLDDLHLAPPSTVEILRFMLRWDRSARLLIAATSHDTGDLGARHGGDSVVTVHLGPLPASAVADLAEAAGCPELSDEVIRLTNGHTLFVLEALRARGDGGTELAVPDSLHAAVAARVAECGPEVEELLRSAVVAGAVFDVEHVAELLDLSGEEVVRRAEVALRAHLLEESGARYQFANEVIRQVLYDTTPAPTRALRHRRLARLLADHPEAAAEHAGAAAEWELAVDNWLVAADRAADAFANSEADALLTRALDACAVLGDPARTTQVQLRRGRVRLAMARYRDAAEDLTAAQALARACADLEAEATAIEELGWCAYHARQIDRSAALAERAVRHPAAGPGARVLAGRLRHAKGDLVGATEQLEAVAYGEGGAADTARALSYLGTVLAHSDRFVEASDVLERSAAICRAAGLLRPMFNAAFFSAIVRANLGDLVGALDITEQIEAELDRFENEAYRPRVHNLLSWVWRELGDAHLAFDHAQRAHESTRLADGHVEAEPAAHALLQLAESALMLGDEAEAGRWLADLTESAMDSVAYGWRVRLRRLDVQARLDPSEAEGLLEQALEHGSTKYRALALAHLGRREEAYTLAADIGSELLIAHVAPPGPADEAVDRIAASLAPELREPFLRRGACAGGKPR